MRTKRCPSCGRAYAGSESFCPHDGRSLEPIEADDPLLGQTLGGRYRVQERLGAGGMGQVYLAEQATIDRPVAVKVLKRERADDPSAVERFMREARATARLKSPHTVTLIDFGQREESGELYLVMELLEGRTLRERVKREGRLPVADAVRIADQVARSLSEAHASGLVHRDLKPGNLFLTDVPEYGEFVKVLDFGVASEIGDDPEASRLTSTGQVPGTPAYLAPERASGEVATPAADVYALGCVLYEMLCGEPPFRGSTPADTILMHVQAEPEPLSKVCPDVDVPPALADLVWRCLAKSPRLRPRDAQAFRLALAACMAGDDAADVTTDRIWTTDAAFVPRMAGPDAAKADEPLVLRPAVPRWVSAVVALLVGAGAGFALGSVEGVAPGVAPPPAIELTVQAPAPAPEARTAEVAAESEPVSEETSPELTEATPRPTEEAERAVEAPAEAAAPSVEAAAAERPTPDKPRTRPTAKARPPKPASSVPEATEPKKEEPARAGDPRIDGWLGP